VFDGILNWKAGGSGLFINLRRCEATATCPKIFEANSSNEYWAKASSMAQTDSLGHDLGGVANVRYYLLRKSAPRRRQRTRHLRAATESAAPQRGLTGAPGGRAAGGGVGCLGPLGALRIRYPQRYPRRGIAP
jgi:hypothetical protein